MRHHVSRRTLALALAGAIAAVTATPAAAQRADGQGRPRSGSPAAAQASLDAVQRAVRAGRRALRRRHGHARVAHARRALVRRDVLRRLSDCSDLYGGPFLCGSIRTPTIPGDTSAGMRTIDFIYRPADVQPAEAVSLLSDGPVTSTFSELSPWKPNFFSYVATAQGAELATRDVILVNTRGTGRDAADCPLLDTPGNPWADAIAECQARLGRTVDYLTAGDSADDLDAVRRHLLGSRKVDLVAIGHATALAQAYLARYEQRVRTAILDPAVDAGPWGSEEIIEPTAIVGRVCARSARCAARIDDAVAEVAWLAARVRTAPIEGWTTLPDGTPWHVTLDEPGVAWGIVAPQQQTFAKGAGLAAAIRALRAGDEAPLLRIAANVGIGDPAPAGPALTDGFEDRSEYSMVSSVARCNEGAAPWGDAVGLDARRAAALDAITHQPADLYGVFSHALFGIDEVCLPWPAAVRANAINPPGRRFARVPILVLGGDLNSDHPSSAARRVAARYPHATYVEIPRGTQPSLLSSGCAGRIARRFLATRRVGDTTCRADEGATVLGIGVFPATVADETPARSASAADASSPRDRRVASVAVATWLDAIAQAWDAGAASGPGLRGGGWSWTDNGDSATWTLDGARFAGDVAVSGEATISFVADNPVADLAVAGAGTDAGVLHVAAPAVFSLASPTARVTGELGGRTIDVTVDLQ